MGGYGGDKRPKFDIDYHNIDGKMSLHKHLYKDGVRQREHLPLTPEEYAFYSKFLSR